MVRLLIAALTVAWTVVPTGRELGAATDPQRAKAAMLWNIAKFVEWPDSAFGGQKQLFVGILGEDDLAVAVAATGASKAINGRPVYVRFVRRPQDASDCQVLFIAASEADRLDAVLGAIGQAPVLTVAATEGFTARGGIVGFVTDADKERFEINLASAHRAGIKISARLLAIARVIETGP